MVKVTWQPLTVRGSRKVSMRVPAVGPEIAVGLQTMRDLEAFASHEVNAAMDFVRMLWRPVRPHLNHCTTAQYTDCLRR